MSTHSGAAVRLFVGSHADYVQREPQALGGDRCFTAAHRPQRHAPESSVTGLLDSGAFSDPPERRLTPEVALERQLRWEQAASERWEWAWRAHALVSYDRLIDETWVAGERHKRRWSVRDAESAVTETIAAAHYLASQRSRLAPRAMVLAVQGVDATQYAECCTEVLRVARPEDWIGLGGWCILGRATRWLPTFWSTLRGIVPLIRRAGVAHIHLFGVLWPRALGGLIWLADRYGLTVSTDSAAPILSATWTNGRKAGARAEYWRDNVEWWRRTLASLRSSEHYREPPQDAPAHQLDLGPAL